MDDRERRNRKVAFAILGCLTLVSVATAVWNEYFLYLSAYLWFGLVYGMCLQYGKFCFSSAFRDLFAVGTPRMAVGIMIAMVPFGIVAALFTAIGASTFSPAPYGIHSVMAGLIFGAGMVLAGGCASGSLYKSGEGSGAAMLVVLSLSVTQAIFVDLGGWFNRLVPQSWDESALAKRLPESIDVGDGWMDGYLAGYVWDRPVATFDQMSGISNPFLAAYVGNVLVGIVVPAAVILAWIYAGWARKAFLKRRAQEGRSSAGIGAELAGYWAMIVASRRTAVAGLLLGIAAGLHIIVTQGLRVKFGVANFAELMTRMGFTSGISGRGTVFDPGYWYVTTQEAQLAGWVFQKLGWDQTDNVFFGFNNGLPNPLINPALWMSAAVVGGAAVMALLHNEFRWKVPTGETATWAILGGALMGIGARLGLGCNIGAFFVRVSEGDPSGWLFGIGMIAGAYGGAKFFDWWTEWRIARAAALTILPRPQHP